MLIKMNWRRFIYGLLSLTLTVGIFGYLFQYVRLSDVIDLLRGVDRGALLFFLLLSLLMSFFRTWRYQVLLQAAGVQMKSSVLFLVVLVRNFCSDLLPARLGTLSYVYILTNRLSVPAAPVFASFTLTFIFDMIALAPLVLLAVLFASGTSLPIGTIGIVAIVLFAVLVTLLRLLPLLCSWIGLELGRLAATTSPTTTTQMIISTRVSTILQGTASGLSSLAKELRQAQHAGIYWRVLALSILVRMAKYTSLYVFLYALIRPLGYGLSEVPFAPALLGICAAELSASLPISGLGGFGLYEGTWAVVFTMIGLPQYIATTTSISHHLFTQVYGYSLGALALLLLMFPWQRQQVKTKTVNPGPILVSATKFWLQLTGVTTLIVLCSLITARILANADTNPPLSEPGQLENCTPEDIAYNAAIPIPGTIVFDSNRSGSFGIYQLEPTTGLISTLIDSKLHEIYPDPSFDGQAIVYARTRSLVRYAPAEVWIMDRTGENSRLLAVDGTFPTFSHDGRFVYFERKRAKIMRIPANGKGPAEEIFPGTNRDFGRFQVVKPRITPDGNQAAFTSDRGGAWNVWIADLKTKAARHLVWGCEPAWFKHDQVLAWVNTKGALDRSGVYRFNLSTNNTTPLQDDGPPWGHEYFPTIIANDQLLLYSACGPDQHSHDNANYQLFMKNLNSKDTLRLTCDAYTNRWPKLLSQLPLND